MATLIISSSLNPRSRSRSLAREAERQLSARGETVRFLDLQETEIPLCDGSSSYGHPNVATTRLAIEEADAILLATPVYNYDANAVAKNLLENTGQAWTNKVVGFLCAAGGAGSYMSIMALANSLMLDFRCVIVPRFVYSHGPDFDGSEIASDEVRRRVELLCEEALLLSRAVAAHRSELAAD